MALPKPNTRGTIKAGGSVLAADREHTFGLYRDDWTPKPQAAAVAEWYGGAA